MKTWGMIVCVALAVLQVLAEEPLAFLEDARRMAGARIVSGWEAEEGQIPWQLSLRMVNPTGAVSSCGGSIIHPLWGITAAHCPATRVTMVLRAGAVSLTRPELIFETTEYYNHPLYIDQLATVVQPNDIALLKFPTEISFSGPDVQSADLLVNLLQGCVEHPIKAGPDVQSADLLVNLLQGCVEHPIKADRVQPIRLQREVERDRNYAGVRLEASGWGRTWTNGPAPEDLQWVYLTGDSNQACWLAFGGSSIIQDSTICASAYNVSSQSTCQGDSGGPLVELEEDGRYTLVGVTSFVSGAGCHADFPAGFIRPGHYHDWYREITGIDFDWEYEEPTTEAPTTEAESSSESSSSESSSEESEETATTEDATTEAPTTEAATTEAATTEAETEGTTESETDATTEAATTEAAATEAETDPTTDAATTEAETDPTTEAATTEEATTEAETDATTEAATTEAETDPTTEAATTEAPTTETEVETPEEEIVSFFSYFRSSFARLY